MSNQGWTEMRPYFGAIYVEKPTPGNGRRRPFKRPEPSQRAMDEATKQLTLWAAGNDKPTKSAVMELAMRLDKQYKAADARAKFILAEFDKLKAAAK